MSLDTADRPTARLCAFIAELEFEQIPPRVVRFAKGLMIDWLGSTLAGKGARQVEIIDGFARAMGPADGPSLVIPTRRRTSPYFAAMVNAAASHVVEQDDVHNGSVFHPAAVIFPAVLAVAEAEGKTGREILTACIAGYEVGIRVGEFLGRSHYQIFHTTGTAVTVAAAAAVGKLIGLDAAGINHALGSASTQAAGLWELLRDAADSKQLHTARAAANGLCAAFLARDGFKGAAQILEGKKGMAAGMSSDAVPARLTDGLGSRWATEETSFKWHASCRHTHPAADALQLLMRREGLGPDDIAEVVTQVHQGAIDVLGAVDIPQTVHQAKFSMGTVLGLIAVNGVADLDAFERQALADAGVTRFRSKVRMEFEIDSLYAIASLNDVCRRLGKSIDHSRVWNIQAIPPTLREALTIAAKHVNDDIVHPPTGISNISEWCKKDQCWTRLQGTLDKLEAALPDEFFEDLLSLEEQGEERKDAKVTQKIDNGIEAQKRVFDIPAHQWRTIMQELGRKRVLTPRETGVLQVAVQMPAKIPTEKQCLVLIGVLEKARNEGLVALAAEEEDA
ncbi:MULTISPECIES: MmgE/PrpD family protein [unclassified Mesorhizobium]|uniref:MmgE/PrpD family protein n=1 Tax=unclassified Mesorhizobium TaxID=325217 RepID=UPI001FDFDB2B|nr:MULTISPECIES: MmgE/PrpD family protein [unclassified Mesorhizobium]